MTISSLSPMPASQLQSLAVSQVVDSAAASQSADQIASDVVKVASGTRVSGRTAQSLTEILQSSKVNLGYSKEEIQSFNAMIKSARDYLDNIKQWAAGQAAAATTIDPDKIAINAQFLTTKEGQEQQRAVTAYDSDFIAKMETNLDQVTTAFLDHKLVFQSFSIGTTGTVSIAAKTFKTDADGNLQTDLDFSFLQSRIDDPNRSKTDPIQYGATWSVNDMRLFQTGVDRVL